MSSRNDLLSAVRELRTETVTLMNRTNRHLSLEEVSQALYEAVDHIDTLAALVIQVLEDHVQDDTAPQLAHMVF